MRVNYWLVKSEPESFSIDDFAKSSDKTTYWDGIRNYQARNYIRDSMKTGDQVIFYHSGTETPAAVGICEIVKESYPDFTAFHPGNVHFDPKSKKETPVWFMVDLKFVGKFEKEVTISQIKTNKKLEACKLVQPGNRLSLFPLLKSEFDEIVKMGSGK
jgi:predicted RNA-binding protein with PUA-like domain